MKRFHATILWVSRAGAYVAVFVLLAMTTLILTEIVLRTGYSKSTHMLDELVGYGIAAMSFLALGHALETGSLIRMNLLLVRLDANSRLRLVLELLSTLFGLIAIGVAIFFFARNVLRSYERGYVSETVAEVPLWMPEGVLLVGLVVFWFQLLSYAIRVAGRRVNLSSERAAEFGFE